MQGDGQGRKQAGVQGKAAKGPLVKRVRLGSQCTRWWPSRDRALCSQCHCQRELKKLAAMDAGASRVDEIFQRSTQAQRTLRSRLASNTDTCTSPTHWHSAATHLGREPPLQQVAIWVWRLVAVACAGKRSRGITDRHRELERGSQQGGRVNQRCSVPHLEALGTKSAAPTTLNPIHST